MQQTRKPKRVPDLRASGRFSKAKKTLMLLSMVAPGALWLLLLRYLPMGGIILAFKNYKIYPKDPTFLNNLIHSKWVGLDNFKFLFTTGDSWVMIRNTLAYNIVFIILGVIIPVAFAVMMSELSKKFVAKTYQTLMFFPYFLSWVVVSYFLNAFIDAQYGLIPMAQRAKPPSPGTQRPVRGHISSCSQTSGRTSAIPRFCISRPSPASTRRNTRPPPSTAQANGSRSCM